LPGALQRRCSQDAVPVNLHLFVTQLQHPSRLFGLGSPQSKQWLWSSYQPNDPDNRRENQEKTDDADGRPQATKFGIPLRLGDIPRVDANFAIRASRRFGR